MSQADKYIGTFSLRNQRLVYRTGSGYRVVQIDPKGTEHASHISSEVVDRLFAICSGETVTAQEARHRIEPYSKKLGLKYHYGWRLRMLVQEILIVLAVTGKLTISKDGNLFLYHVA